MNEIHLISRLKKYRLISGLLGKETFHEFKKYIIVGLASFSLEYLMFFILYKFLGLWYMLANTIVYIIIFWFNFLVNRAWSFKRRENFVRQLALYGTLFVFNLFAINLLMYLISDGIGITPLISKVMVMCFVVSWNFILYKKIIYK